VTLSLRRVSLAASLYYMFCALVCGGQTVNVNQIRPSTTNTQVITTVGGATVWAPAPGGIPSAQGTAPIQVNGASGVPATGAITIACPTCGAGAFQVQVVPPVACTNAAPCAIIFPTEFVATSGSAQNTASGSNTSGSLTQDLCGQAGGAPSCLTAENSTVVWSGFSLPSAVSAASVTQIFAFTSASVSSVAGVGESATAQLACGGTDFAFLNAGQSNFTTTPVSVLLPSVPGSAIPTITCTATIASGGTVRKSLSFNQDVIALIVYYTGSPVAQPDVISVEPALTLNFATNTLGFDTSYNFGIAGGSSTAYTLGLPAFGIPQVGTEVLFSPPTANTTTAPTLNLNGFTAITIVKGRGDSPLAVGDTGDSSTIDDVILDGNGFWVLQNPQSGSSGSGLSGMTAGQVPIAATATTVTSSKALAGAGAGLTTGPTTSVSGDCVEFSGTGGQIADNGSPCGSSSGGLTALTGDGTASGSGSQPFTAVNLPGHIALTGIPSVGQVPTATSPTAATWQTPSSAGGLPFQYVWRVNCPDSGGTTGTTLFEWAKYSNEGDSSCVETTTTADGSAGAGASPIIGIVQSGAGTTGFAQIAVSGVAQCQFDTSLATTQGNLVKVSPNTAGMCASETAGPTNEDPETNVFLGTADAAGAAGAVIGVDLTAIVGNYGNYSAFTTPFLTMLCGANNGAQFAVPCALQQDGPTPGAHTAGTPATGIFPLLPLKFAYSPTPNFALLGASTMGASGHDFEIDTVDAGSGSPANEMFAMRAASYNIPTVQSISGTVGVCQGGVLNMGCGDGNFIFTLAGNATIPTPVFDNPGHISSFEIIQAASGGPFTLTYPSNFINVPTVSAVASSATLFQVMFDGTNWNCISGCASSGSGSGVPSVNGITTAVTIAATSPVSVSTAGSTVTIACSSCAGGGGAVSSVFGRTAAVTANTGDYTVAQVTGAAPLASPTFTGIPAAPTAAASTNTTQLATTAFVTAALAAAGSAAGIVTYSGPSLTFTGTAFFPIGGGGLSSTTETNVDLAAPASATVKNFTVQLSVAPGTGNSIAFTWRDNAASTAVTCTVSGSATSCSDLTHSFTASAGDLLDIQAVTSGTILSASTAVMGTQVGVASSGGGAGNYVNLASSLSATGCTISGNVCTVGTATSSVTISSIPGTFLNLELYFNGTSTNSTNVNVNFQFNGDSGSDYDTVQIGNGASAPQQFLTSSGTSTSLCQAGQTGNFAGSCKATFPQYSGTSFFKSGLSMTNSGFSSGTLSQFSNSMAWHNTSAITSITMTTSSGNFSAGDTFALYGTN
jgi:hypothetical protein